MKKYFLTALTLLPSLVLAMVPLEDNEMAEVTGQSLLVADYIKPEGTIGGPRDFHYYRMGLDALVELNMNIDKLQLGCGGYNEAVRANSCDVDMDYVRFMGRQPVGVSNDKQPTGAKRAGDPVTSDFEMMRPYFEIAVRDVGGGQREIAGFKISAEYANGFFGVGSHENGVHTGINSLSGAMEVYLSGYATFSSGLGGGSTCIGQPTTHSRCNDSNKPLFFKTNPEQTKGVRMTELKLTHIELDKLDGSGLLGIFDGRTLYAQMSARLKELHGFELAYTEDFFIAFQREPIEYPKYNKSGYSTRAETGWWMNAPRVEIADLSPANIDLGCPRLCLGLLDAFNAPGINAGYPDMRQNPPINCYGGYKFC